MYGIHYKAVFQDVGGNNLSLEILKKDYSGEVFDLFLGASPVIHQWETDDCAAPIRGSSLKIGIINKDNLTPLSSFYSIEDDAFLVKLFNDNQLLFIGNLVQDDCSEELVDFTHEIQLSANDNLGLLKDVALDKTEILSNNYNQFPAAVSTYGNAFYVIVPYYFQILAGDQITITGDPLINGTYKITSVIYNGGNSYTLYVSTTPRAGFYYATTMRITKQFNLLEKQTLATIVMMCLRSTGLELPTSIYTRLHENSQVEINSFFEQTLINPQSFLKNSTDYDDCYSVLQQIMQAFNCSVFQAKGKWNIIRWDELRNDDNNIAGYEYDSNFNLTSYPDLPDLLEAGRGEDIYAKTGLIKKLNRPLVSILRTFNYKYPAQLLRNYDLKQTGGLLREYTTGSGDDLKKIKEYSLIWWEKAGFPALFYPGDYFIRVTYDSLDNELERVIVANGYCRSFPIEVNEGDVFKFSFQCRTQDSQPGPLSWVFYVELTDGVNKRRFMNPALTSGLPMWRPAGGFVYQVRTGDNSDNWQSVEIDCTKYPLPFTGILYVYLQPLDLSGPLHESYYKDLRLDYSAKINESTKIIGQTHLISQDLNIKNKEELDINIDDSPRNAISGTLFLNELTGIVQKRTSLWGYSALDSRRLNEVVEQDEIKWRNQTRTILEGDMYSKNDILSVLNIHEYTYFPELYLIWGRLEIDYKAQKYSGTLYEKWNKNEMLLPFNYKFDYIYDTK